jgi:hypothetical protein
MDKDESNLSWKNQNKNETRLCRETGTYAGTEACCFGLFVTASIHSLMDISSSQNQYEDRVYK